MQPDLPEPRQPPGRSPLDDLRERLARLPASHPSAPGYREWPDEPTEHDGRAGGDPPAPADPPPGGDRPGGAAWPGDAATPDDLAGPDDAAGEPDGTEGDSEPGGPGPGRPDAGGRPGGTAVGYMPRRGGDGPYRPWFTGEAPQPWFGDEAPQPLFSDDPAGRSG